MGSRVSVDPLAGYGPLVDKSLGDAYKTVRRVADNLPALLALPTLAQYQQLLADLNLLLNPPTTLSFNFILNTSKLG